MTELRDRLVSLAAETGVSPESARCRHLLHGVLRRWSKSRHAGALVLRGGLMTQLWVGPGLRETKDIDFVGLYPRDMDDTATRLREILVADGEDGIAYDPDTLRGEVIWQETEFPGLRFTLRGHLLGEERGLQIDVGFGDPIVPPARWIDYPCLIGPPARVQAVIPELLVAWKLDGLFDHGPKRWQAKDLYDLHLLTGHCTLDLPLLAEGIRVAFEAHSDPLEQVLDVVYNRSWWETESSRNKWAKFRAAAAVPVPSDLLEVATGVARALHPALARLIAFPARTDLF